MEKRLSFLIIQQTIHQLLWHFEIANDLESGKIVGKKIISDALFGVSCCFMDNENLKI